MPEVINSLSGDQSSQLAEFAAKLRARAEQPIVEQPASTSVETTQASSAPVPEVQSLPVADANATKEDPKPEVPTATEAVELPEWDAEIKTDPTPTAPTVDFEKLGSALKLEGIKSESDLVTKVNEYKTKLQELESQKAATFEGLPEELKEVLDLAKQGGDWKSYMGASTVNWKNVDPVQLFERELAMHFRNTDGSLDEERYLSALDATPEATKLMEGSRIIQQRIFEQQQFKNRQIEQARIRKQEADQALAQATRKLGDLLPFEEYGIKFDSKHSDYLFNGISNGQLLQKHFLTDNGQYDMKKVARTIALAEYGDKMIRYQAEKAKIAGKKELLQQTQNVQLDSTKRSAAPDAGSEKQMSVAEKMQKFMESKKSVGL